MSDKVIISKSKLTTLADYIRAKSKTSGLLTLDSMASAINELNTGSAIEVEELPQEGWKGTPVPEEGELGRIYFNKNLSYDEVVSICAGLPYIPFGSFSVYPVYATQDASSGFGVLTINGEYGVATLKNGSANAFYFVTPGLASAFGSSETGWLSTVDGHVDINAYNYKSLIAPSDSYLINDKLTALFSLTPFEKIEKPDEGAIYKVISTEKLYIYKDGEFVELSEEGSGGGIVELDELHKPVPNSGYVEKVYFNTNLSVDEVVKVLDRLEYSDVLNAKMYGILYVNVNEGEKQITLAVIKVGDFFYFIQETITGTIIFANDNYLGDKYIDFYGWNPNLESGFEINNNVLNNAGSILSVGEQNDLLVTLVSTTPFKKGEGVEDGFYRLKPTGTAVPESGLIEKVYLNELDDAGIHAILKKISYPNLPGYGEVYPLIVNSDMTKKVAVTAERFDGDITYYNIVCDEDLLWRGYIPDNTGIWLTVKPVLELELGYENAFSMLAPMFGVPSQNELLKDLFSITPFEVKYYTIKDGQYVELTEGGSSNDMLQARVDATNNCSYLFYYYTGDNVDYIANLDTSKVTNMCYMFSNTTRLTTIPQLNTSKVTNMSYMFNNSNYLSTIPQMDTSNVTNFRNMFYYCAYFITPPRFDISKATDINSMFASCSRITKVDLSGYNISNSSNSSGLISSCYSLKALIIRSFGANYAIHTNLLSNCYHFTGTKQNPYNPTGAKDGYIYVPRDMVETLKSATNWSSYADYLRALEDYTVDGTVDGDLDESKI